MYIYTQTHIYLHIYIYISICIYTYCTGPRQHRFLASPAASCAHVSPHCAFESWPFENEHSPQYPSIHAIKYQPEFSTMFSSYNLFYYLMQSLGLMELSRLALLFAWGGGGGGVGGGGVGVLDSRFAPPTPKITAVLNGEGRRPASDTVRSRSAFSQYHWEYSQ